MLARRLLFLGALLFASPASAQFGELPEGADLTIGYGGEVHEVAFGVLVPIDSVASLLPEGVTPAPQGDGGRFAMFALALVAAESIIVRDTIAVTDDSGFAYQAAWWLITEPSEDSEGRTIVVNAVSLHEFYSDGAVVSPLREVGVNAGRADIRIWDSAARWNFSFQTSTYSVSGSCTVTADPVPLQGPIPRYAYVHHSGEPGSHNLLTFYGHHFAPCDPQLEFSGSGRFISWLRDAPEDLRLPASYQPGWIAAGGIYSSP